MPGTLTEELASRVESVPVDVDVEARLIRVTAAQTDDAAESAAIDAVGYEAVRAQAPMPDPPLA